VPFETVNSIPNSPSNFNAALSQVLLVVPLDQQRRRSLDLLRWGLIPFWAKDAAIGSRCINAMAETVAAKPAFREAFRRGRRCLVPVDGFYEWAKTPRAKQPYLIGMADGSPLVLAGL
jgi:putative SOS response-associated peptidase YedK